MTWDGRNQKEIKSRIAQAKMGFNSKQKWYVPPQSA